MKITTKMFRISQVTLLPNLVPFVPMMSEKKTEIQKTKGTDRFKVMTISNIDL